MYSYKWCAKRVRELVDSYPRATNYVCKMLGIKPIYLVNSLANQWESWETLKRLIKKVDRLMSLRYREPLNHSTSVVLMQQAAWQCGFNVPNPLDQALTRSLLCTML